MSKKVFFSTTLVLILALMMSGTAFAATSTYTRYANRVGIVTAAGNGNLTIQTISGQLFTVKVGASTQVQRVSGGFLSFRNIGVGQWITAIGTFDRQHVLNANTIVVMPTQFTKGNWIGKRAYGTVLQVIPGSMTFTLVTQNGRMNFTVDDSTEFAGNSVRSFSALTAGMHAVVGYSVQRDGNLYARGVSAY
jgi:hypothetical protein